MTHARAALVIADPLADLLRLEDERSYTRVREAISAWVPPVADDGAAVVGVLHSHRDRDLRAGGGDQVGSYLGSVGFGSACDLLIELLADRKDMASTGRNLHCCKSRIGALRRGEVKMLTWSEAEGYGEARGVPLVPPAPADDLEPKVRAWLAKHPGGSLRSCSVALAVPMGGSARYVRLRDLFRVLQSAS